MKLKEWIKMDYVLNVLSIAEHKETTHTAREINVLIQNFNSLTMKANAKIAHQESSLNFQSKEDVL